MAFGDKAKKQQNDNSTSDIYMKLNTGEKTIRILDREETAYWRYWVNSLNGKDINKSITIGSMKDPIPRYYESLGKDHPDYRSIQKRFLLNVLDRTPNANGEVPNQVRILELGTKLVNKFSTFDKRVRDRKTFEPLPITRFDIITVPQGSGKEIDYTLLIGDDLEELPQELLSLLKFDLSQVYRPMPASSQDRLLAGDDYADVIRDLGWEKPVATVPIDDVPF